MIGQLLIVGHCLAHDDGLPKAKGFSEVAKETVNNNASLVNVFGDLKSKPDLIIEVSGRVISSDGQGIPGVNVLVKDTGSGTVTDIEGNFSINVPNEDNILVFSAIGFISQEVTVNGRSVINVTLEEDLQNLDEVVVVGYGQQKKANLTGSVSNIRGEAIENMPVTQASQALAGQMSGINVRQTSGAPGKGQANIRIRGHGTFSGAGNNPLVLIDGVPSSLDNLDPNDIASISVLKDAASAAIYGSRAANGVILVETKRGKEGELGIAYNGYVGIQNETETPEFVDSWIYARATNEALSNMGQGQLYSEEDIQKFESGNFPDEFPNAHHYKRAFNSGNGFQTNHNIQLTGGGSENSFLFSLGYLRKNGLIQENWFDRYNMRFNFDSEVTEKLNLKISLAGNKFGEHEPAAFTGDGTLERLVTRITRQPATEPWKTSEGWYGHVDRGAPSAALDSENFAEDKGHYFLGSTDITYNIFESLEIIGRAGYEFNASKYKMFRSYFQVTPYLLQSPSRLNTELSSDNTLTLETLLRYRKTIQDHEINFLGGYSQNEFRSEWTQAFRDQFPNNELYELGAGSSSNMQNDGSAEEWALKSYFSRLGYSYQEKFLFEVNARYDGSSRFPEGNRYGFFPSFSGGWIISEENFIKDNLSWVSFLKLRGSWGKLGNQQIGAYPYQEVLNMGQNYVYGNSVVSGAAVTRRPNEDITWETTRMIDIGLDLELIEGKLSLTTDYYSKKTNDILYQITTAGTLGMSASAQNAGEVKNEGWEFFLLHRNSLGDFSYSVAPNFSLVNTEVLSLAQVEKDIGQNLFVGQPLNAIYGYLDDGLFVNQEDIQNYPEQPYSPEPGDIRYKDINGPEGVPDGRVTADYDRTVIGQTEPRYTYGAQFTANYKNFDLTLTLHGEGGMRRELENYAARAFANGSNVQEWMWDNRWTPENPDRNAIYPRFILHGEGRNDPYAWHSTYWAWDASYLRIKFLQIGYRLPADLLQSLKINQMRLYVSGSNLYSFDNYVPGWDPEMQVISSGGGKYYPLSRVFNLGVNVKF
jgi:TonB-linked SusC/RagA family outer membrane protein